MDDLPNFERFWILYEKHFNGLTELENEEYQLEHKRFWKYQETLPELMIPQTESWKEAGKLIRLEQLRIINGGKPYGF